MNGIDVYGYWNQYGTSKAIDYARKYAIIPNIKTYKYYPSGDCANFVSQCLFAGGIPMVRKHWYCYQKNKYRSNSWTIVADQMIFLGSQYFRFNGGVGFFDPSYLANCKKEKRKKEAEKLVSAICKFVRAGDVMYLDLKIDKKKIIPMLHLLHILIKQL